MAFLAGVGPITLLSTDIVGCVGVVAVFFPGWICKKYFEIILCTVQGRRNRGGQGGQAPQVLASVLFSVAKCPFFP